jgi:voltage-gated potassium channel
MSSKEGRRASWRERLHEVVFESDTPAGKAFDVTLIVAILMSVVAVMLESVGSVRAGYGKLLYGIEWFFTILFTFEYALRLICVRRPAAYVFSFFGIIDLLALAPTYLSLLLPGGQYLLTIRILRLLRVFRVLKLTHYVSEANVITTALHASRRKISVFLLAVLSVVVIVGTLIYVIEGEEHGFTDIPTGIYWSIVTLTTVGYGDLSPQTPAGKVLASVVMILGYGIIAVPTGIVTAELSRAAVRPVSGQTCPGCSAEGHLPEAKFCFRCGAHL